MTSPEVQLQEDGRKLLVSFYAALRAVKFYPIDNETVQKALLDLDRMVKRLIQREGLMDFRVVGDFFFLNETRLRLDLRNFSTFGSVARTLHLHGIGEVHVEEGIEKEEWAAFLSIILRDPEPEDPFEGVSKRIMGSNIRHISIEAEREIEPLDLEEAKLDGAKRTYAFSVQMARDVLTDVRIGRAVNVRKVKRAVQTIVDQVLTNEPSMVAMTHLRDFDEYTFTHSVNVCIFSVVIGQRLGLEKLDLYDLGLGALFHDVGKMRVPAEVLNKPEGLNEEDWALMKEHPTDGLLQLFQLHGFNDVPFRQMLMAYEHHMKTDLKGYPSSRRPRSPTLFSLIVSVADAFDAGTSRRSYQYRPWPPDAVLREMKENPKRGFHPLIVKALITATGIYPVGTLVILDSYEMGVVTKANPDPKKLHQPEIKILSDEMGTPLAIPRTVRLDELDETTGDLKRSIIKTADPNRYGIQVAEYVTVT